MSCRVSVPHNIWWQRKTGQLSESWALLLVTTLPKFCFYLCYLKLLWQDSCVSSRVVTWTVAGVSFPGGFGTACACVHFAITVLHIWT